MAIYDLTQAKSYVIINEGIILDAANVGSGTGNYNTFLAIQDNDHKNDPLFGSEYGFNSDDKPKLDSSNDEMDHSKTHSLLLSSIPIIEVNGGLYYEFRVDLNESNSTEQISLNQFTIRTSTDPTIVSRTNVENLNVAYSLGSNQLLLNEVSTGSGTDDYSILVPVSKFPSGDAIQGTYIYVEVDFGDIIGEEEEVRLANLYDGTTFETGDQGKTTLVNYDFTVDGGFEEWNTEIAGTLTGLKFEDLNGNGEQDVGEKPIAGVTIFMDDDGDGELDDGERSTTTNEDGRYSFYSVPIGTYTIDEVVPEGYEQTTGSNETATISSYAQVVEVDPIGNQPLAADLSVIKSDSTSAAPGSNLTAGQDPDPEFTPGPDPILDFLNDVTYTIQVTNNSNVPSVNVVVTDTLPDELTFVSATDSGVHADNGSDPDTVTWSLGTLAAGESRLLYVTVEALDAIAPGYELNVDNLVSVTADTPDDDLSNNTNSENTIRPGAVSILRFRLSKPSQELQGAMKMMLLMRLVTS